MLILENLTWPTPHICIVRRTGNLLVLKTVHIQGINIVDGTSMRFVSTSTIEILVYSKVFIWTRVYLWNSCLSMEKPVMEVKKKYFRTLRNICKIRFLLSNDQLKVIVNSLVVFCLDYIVVE